MEWIGSDPTNVHGSTHATWFDTTSSGTIPNDG